MQSNNISKARNRSKTQKLNRINTSQSIRKSLKPRDLITQLEDVDLPKLFQHEQNTVHQYKIIKSLKDSLTEKDAIIHIDFSKNHTTKCNQEIQSYHFGGSRTQILLHTVVVYTMNKITFHCTVLLNLSHNAGAI